VITTRDTPRPRAGRAAFAPRPAGRTRLVLPQPPDDTEKYSYLQRNLPFLTTTIVISAACLTISQIRFELHDTAMWPFMVFTATYVLYLLTGLPVNFTGRGFNFAAHQERIAAWHPSRYPDVDIFLPICGEPIEVLHNTWTAVAGLLAAYPGAAQAFVLDDGPSDEAQALAADIGLGYIRRPGQRVHKKAGNLRYAFARTSSEFIVIFDADFAPRPDFLAETLPYLDDPELGIVVTPQYFRQSPEQTWIENAAGAIQEVFYRSIQVSRDRFGAAICTGTSSVYRRVALEPVKGATLIPYAEDVHTGLDVRLAGWSIRYVPLLLSTGICPDNLDSFVRQQYRWCTGNAGIVFSHRLWGIRMSVAARLTFLSGFFYYAYTGLLNFVGPLIPVIMLAFLPGQIRLRNFVILLPAAFAGFVLYALWHRSSYRPSVWPLGIARGWAHVFALWDGAWGKTMSWHPSRTPGSSLRRFRLAVTWWSGGMAVLWVLLAIWRSVTPGSVQFAVLLGFGLLNLAVVGRVIFPGRNAA
jgi:cellulose synthase (UDP-forming)